MQWGHTSSGVTREVFSGPDAEAAGETRKPNPDLLEKNRKVPPTIATPARPAETTNPLEAQKESRY